MPYGVIIKKAPITINAIWRLDKKTSKTSVTFVLHEQESTCGLLRHSYSYIYTQETGRLKAMASKIQPPILSHHLHGFKVGLLNRRLTNDTGI